MPPPVPRANDVPLLERKAADSRKAILSDEGDMFDVVREFIREREREWGAQADLIHNRDVWNAFRHYGVSVCPLYARGYRSLGARARPARSPTSRPGSRTWRIRPSAAADARTRKA